MNVIKYSSMKKGILSILFTLFCVVSFSQTSENYQLKAQFLYGNVLKHTEHLKNLVKGSTTGGEIAIEWKTDGDKDWHQHYHYPTIGLALNFTNLGNPDTLGYSIALYPYLNIPIIKTDYFTLNVKPGAGISYVTKTFGDFKDEVLAGTLSFNRSNAAIGSHLNVFFSAGLNLEVPITSGLSLTADYAWNHISNGSIIVPNSGINMLNAYVGLKYFPNYKNYSVPINGRSDDIDKNVSVELTVSGGIRQLYYKDDKNFPIGSLAVGVYKPLTNFYRTGFGVDMFYDGVFTNGLKYKRTYIETDELKNKIRAGISWQNELIIGRLIAGIHAGIYLYNPIKNLEPYTDAVAGTLHKGLIYPYDIEKEDGWLYTRVSGKYLITDHIYAAIGLKTHLQKAEFIEWGVGYRF